MYDIKFIKLSNVSLPYIESGSNRWFSITNVIRFCLLKNDFKKYLKTMYSDQILRSGNFKMSSPDPWCDDGKTLLIPDFVVIRVFTQDRNVCIPSTSIPYVIQFLDFLTPTCVECPLYEILGNLFRDKRIEYKDLYSVKFQTSNDIGVKLYGTISTIVSILISKFDLDTIVKKFSIVSEETKNIIHY